MEELSALASEPDKGYGSQEFAKSLDAYIKSQVKSFDGFGIKRTGAEAQGLDNLNPDQVAIIERNFEPLVRMLYTGNVETPMKMTKEAFDESGLESSGAKLSTKPAFVRKDGVEVFRVLDDKGDQMVERKIRKKATDGTIGALMVKFMLSNKKLRDMFGIELLKDAVGMPSIKVPSLLPTSAKRKLTLSGLREIRNFVSNDSSYRQIFLTQVPQMNADPDSFVRSRISEIKPASLTITERNEIPAPISVEESASSFDYAVLTDEIKEKFEKAYGYELPAEDELSAAQMLYLTKLIQKC
jgi:hypothetical protein